MHLPPEHAPSELFISLRDGGALGLSSHTSVTKPDWFGEDATSGASPSSEVPRLNSAAGQNLKPQRTRRTSAEIAEFLMLSLRSTCACVLASVVQMVDACFIPAGGVPANHFTMSLMMRSGLSGRSKGSATYRRLRKSQSRANVTFGQLQTVYPILSDFNPRSAIHPSRATARSIAAHSTPLWRSDQGRSSGRSR